MSTTELPVLCSMCADDPASSFCSCTGVQVYFCIHCVVCHISQDSAIKHEVTSMADALKPCDDFARRKLAIDRDIEALRRNVDELATWKREMISIADYMVRRLTEFRESVERETYALQREAELEVSQAVQELCAKMKLKEPTFTSAIAKAVYRHKTGTMTLMTCQTSFNETRQAVDAFLYSLNLQLQADVPGFAPTGLIAHKGDIVSSRKVNVYYPLAPEFFPSFCQSNVRKFAEYPLPQDKVIPTIRRGPVAFSDGCLYLGSWSQQNHPHGPGHELRPTGGIFTGTFLHDKYSGKGKYTWADGTWYEGEFEAGNRHGFGKRRYLHGYTYMGQWVRGSWQGLGAHVQDHEDGLDCFFGEFFNGEKEGKGVHFWKEDYIYAGEFRAGTRHGKGVLYQKGQTFYGEFGKNGKKIK